MPLMLDRIVVCYPNGNPTALICCDAPFAVSPHRLHRAIVQHPALVSFGIEQCGYLLPATADCDVRLQMLGGEFCGNAARSAVRVAHGTHDGQGLIAVSGSSRALPWRVNARQVAVTMPIDIHSPIEAVADGYLVHLEGISHLVHRQHLEDLAALSPHLLRTYGLDKHEAAGISSYDGTHAHFCIYIAAVDTLVMETACGSGTASIALVKYQKEQQTHCHIRQPSGEVIHCHIDDEERLWIAGEVRILFDDALEIDIEMVE